MSDWRRILCTEDIKFVAFHPILRTTPLISTKMALAGTPGTASLFPLTNKHRRHSWLGAGACPYLALMHTCLQRRPEARLQY